MRGPVGVILAGGKSSRMGSDKALVELAGRPMIEWVAEAMSGFDQVVVVGRRPGWAGLEAIPDLQPDAAGPLSGLQTALAAFQRPLVVTAVDQPLVRPETLRRLAEWAMDNRTALCLDGLPQVTCAAYSSDCLDQAIQELGSSGSIQRMLESVPWTRIEPEVWSGWGEDGRSWYSMDSWDDILAAEHRFRVNLAG
ncbi:MAG: molybdenum cofactor guanylyltransferase [Acidimicrobiia bacterium]|nr:molybdenum cofactor guanylyltransferase [bacterium]MXX63476.1 molybdenum cofactor guanylyltransferase [Acidimicrobiia bacterium]MCY3580704.1 molybdenum cofactor guanylyltransferase [bacterium]MCY3652837.1 molybdenum cofactor guanylyltransferase [bacterium]MDE0643707.1 molybdenum cofactor guanylyltransferase [bacterium]